MNHEQVKQVLLQDAETRHAYEHPPLRLEVARAVVTARRALGLSQTQLAELLGTSQTQVWRIESGDANVKLGTLERLHDVLGLHFCIETEEPRQKIKPIRPSHAATAH